MPLTVLLAADAVARDRVVHLRPCIPQGDAFLLTGAVGVGLNRWTLRSDDFPPGPSFAPEPGERVEFVAVAVSDVDMERAARMALQIDAPLEHVLGAALCTGLAILTGGDTVCGPFLPPEQPDTEPPVHAPPTKRHGSPSHADIATDPTNGPFRVGFSQLGVTPFGREEE